jgi:hypothetical protein
LYGWLSALWPFWCSGFLKIFLYLCYNRLSEQHLKIKKNNNKISNNNNNNNNNNINEKYVLLQFRVSLERENTSDQNFSFPVLSSDYWQRRAWGLAN